MCHVTIYLSFIYPPICSSIYLFQKRRRKTHTERREGHQNVFYIPNYYMLYWFLRAIVNYRSILSFQSEYPVLATWFLPVRNNSCKRRLFSENTHYRHNYFFRKSKRHKVLTACVPKIVHCSIIIFESGNREVTRLKLVSNLWGIYPTWFQVLQTF